MRLRKPAAIAVTTALLLTACSAQSTSGAPASRSGASGASTAPSTPAPSPTTPTGPPPKPVHVSLLEGDGGVYGVGMPIIAWFDRAPTDASAFDKAVTVTVNGRPASGAWYWQKSGHAGSAVEAHYRMQQYWPAHARIRMDAPVKGLSAGKGLAYDNSLTLSMSTGAANIATVDGRTERMIVTSDGKKVFDFPTSLGSADTPTYSGTKVVMEKNRVERMKSEPGQPYYSLDVPWSVRLTNSGEFVHAASWNGGNIGVRSTSHGCTNLTVEDAKRYFQFARLGDVFTYTNTGGPPMPSWDGYGDWNVSWPAWRAGGILG